MIYKKNILKSIYYQTRFAVYGINKLPDCGEELCVYEKKHYSDEELEIYLEAMKKQLKMILEHDCFFKENYNKFFEMINENIFAEISDDFLLYIRELIIEDQRNMFMIGYLNKKIIKSAFSFAAVLFSINVMAVIGIKKSDIKILNVLSKNICLTGAVCRVYQGEKNEKSFIKLAKKSKDNVKIYVMGFVPVNNEKAKRFLLYKFLDSLDDYKYIYCYIIKKVDISCIFTDKVSLEKRINAASKLFCEIFDNFNIYDKTVLNLVIKNSTELYGFLKDKEDIYAIKCLCGLYKTLGVIINNLDRLIDISECEIKETINVFNFLENYLFKGKIKSFIMESIFLGDSKISLSAITAAEYLGYDVNKFLLYYIKSGSQREEFYQYIINNGKKEILEELADTLNGFISGDNLGRWSEAEINVFKRAVINLLVTFRKYDIYPASFINSALSLRQDEITNAALFLISKWKRIKLFDFTEKNYKHIDYIYK